MKFVAAEGVIKKQKIMATEKMLNEKILTITLEIAEKYPELSKYLEEMPVTIPNVPNPEMGLATLQEYYASLQNLLQEYAAKHAPE